MSVTEAQRFHRYLQARLLQDTEARLLGFDPAKYPRGLHAIGPDLGAASWVVTLRPDRSDSRLPAQPLFALTLRPQAASGKKPLSLPWERFEAVVTWLAHDPVAQQRLTYLRAAVEFERHLRAALPDWLACQAVKDAPPGAVAYEVVRAIPEDEQDRDHPARSGKAGRITLLLAMQADPEHVRACGFLWRGHAVLCSWQTKEMRNVVRQLRELAETK